MSDLPTRTPKTPAASFEVAPSLEPELTQQTTDTLPAPTGLPVVDGTATHFMNEHHEDIKLGREIFEQATLPAPEVPVERADWVPPKAYMRITDARPEIKPTRWERMRTFGRSILSRTVQRADNIHG